MFHYGFAQLRTSCFLCNTQVSGRLAFLLGILLSTLIQCVTAQHCASQFGHTAQVSVGGILFIWWSVFIVVRHLCVQQGRSFLLQELIRLEEYIGDLFFKIKSSFLKTFLKIRASSLLGHGAAATAITCAIIKATVSYNSA